MTDELTRYTAFYKSKHAAHKLDWDHSLGTATLRAKFSKGEKELSVSLYQAIVLLLFNEEASLAFSDIQERTRMGKGLFNQYSVHVVNGGVSQRVPNFVGRCRVSPVARNTECS